MWKKCWHGTLRFRFLRCFGPMWLFSFRFCFAPSYFSLGNQQSSDLQPSNVAEDDRQSCVAVDLFTNGPLYKIEIGPSRSVLLGPSCSVRLGYAAAALHERDALYDALV